jgi:hypothetical protein
MTRFSLQDPDLFRRQAYVGGHWCDADNGTTLEVNNPATGEILGTVPRMGTAETRRAIEAAKGAWGEWRRKPAKDRSSYPLVSKSRLDTASPRWQRQSGLLIGKDESPLMRDIASSEYEHRHPLPH